VRILYVTWAYLYMKKLVSILIPACNAAEFIADTIKSVLAQTWPQKEIIVVNDGSQDDTLAIAREFESKQVLVVTKDNEGAAELNAMPPVVGDPEAFVRVIHNLLFKPWTARGP
jgi:glycosyltransferase involved in cell wall biosynthesis